MTRYDSISYNYRDTGGRFHHDTAAAIEADSVRDAIRTLEARVDGTLETVWMCDTDPDTHAVRLWEAEGNELTCFTEGNFADHWQTVPLFEN